MSRDRLEEHRRIWAAKPGLREVYRVWFEALVAEVPSGPRTVLEVGAGPGFLSAHARARRPEVRWLGADIVTVPWNDLVADAHRLPFGDGTVDGIVGLDVVHHLAHPGEFFAEAARVLKTEGRLAVVEPWVTAFSYPVYRWLHQEGCTLGLDPWNPFGPGETHKDAFEGDAAVLWRMVRTTGPGAWRRLGLGPPRVRLFNAFAYLPTLGFRPASLLPRSLAGPLLWLDRVSAQAAPLFGLRALASWQPAGGETAGR